MSLEDLMTIEPLTAFLSGTQVMAFSVIRDQDDGYHRIQKERANSAT